MPPPVAPEPPARSVPYVGRLAIGLATLFVPMSVLRSLSIVQFPGGRGLLFLTDLDTLFLDATMVVAFVLLYRRWRGARRQIPYACFVLLLAGVTAVLLAYVVTNFGTLFRLRLMMAVPVWMLALAAAPHPAERADEA
ncbi:MAG: hypothetical protein ACREKS_23755 [Candidatus Rokuibacteriota bacterium]